MMTASARVRLGPDLAAGELPQAIVPAHAWQAAESTGDWTLVGCTVAPGFDFAKFELAATDWAPDRSWLRKPSSRTSHDALEGWRA